MDSEPTPMAPRGPGRGAAAGALIFAAFALSGLSGCAPKSQDAAHESGGAARNVTLTAAQQQHIRLYTVAAATYRRTLEVPGVVDFDNDQATSVLAPFSGPVSRLLVSAGDTVRKGQPLATVDSPDFATAISTYAKALATAQTDRKLAEADADLAQHNGVSQRESQQAQTDAANAEADRDAALQGLVALDVDPQTIATLRQGRPVAHVEGVIRSPIAGKVAEKLITPGQLLQAGTTPAFTVADLSRMWVMAQIPASQQEAVHVGDAAEVDTGVGGRPYPGTVANIAAVVNPDTRSAPARVVVDNPGGVLKKQMYVRVRIEARQPGAGLLVPVSAVLRDDENLPFVYVAQTDGAYARRPVTVGERVDDRVEILGGLQAGERIVVDGGIFVQFMQNQ